MPCVLRAAASSGRRGRDAGDVGWRVPATTVGSGSSRSGTPGGVAKTAARPGTRTSHAEFASPRPIPTAAVATQRSRASARGARRTASRNPGERGVPTADAVISSVPPPWSRKGRDGMGRPIEMMPGFGCASRGWLAALCEQPAITAAPPSTANSTGRDRRMKWCSMITRHTVVVVAEVPLQCSREHEGLLLAISS
jgi:hypothetical protein